MLCRQRFGAPGAQDLDDTLRKSITLSNFFSFLEVYRQREGLDRIQATESSYNSFLRCLDHGARSRSEEVRLHRRIFTQLEGHVEP